MKKLLLLSIAGFLFVSANYAQSTNSIVSSVAKVGKTGKTNDPQENLKPLKKMEGTAVSSLAKQEFSTIYGDIPAKWTRTAYYDQVSFASGGEQQTAYYDADSKLVGTIIQKKFEDLPDASQQEINKEYPGYVKEDIVFFNDNELNATNIVIFNKQFEDMDCYYVKLRKSNSEVLVKVKQSGEVSFYKQLH